jgi:hypothetical protein
VPGNIPEIPGNEGTMPQSIRFAEGENNHEQINNTAFSKRIAGLVAEFRKLP